MIAGSAPDGTDLEYSPPVGKRPSRVAPPLGDVVAAQDATIRRLENTVANQATEMAQLRVFVGSLVARVYALEQHTKIGHE